MQKSLNSNKQPVITVEQVEKTYETGHPSVLQAISLSVAADEFLCLIGPSGCGKSTLLKLMAGLEQPSAGSVQAPKEISMVFQNGALLPWLSAYDNVALGLRTRNTDEKTTNYLTKKFLNMVGLADFAHKYPRELSGGQRQRVGIARALAVEPRVLLLDEPFSALDPKTTDELHHDILRIWKDTGVTVIMVSHLIEEAVSLADRVVLMKEGCIEDIYPILFPYPRREQGAAFLDLVLKIRKAFFK